MLTSPHSIFISGTSFGVQFHIIEEYSNPHFIPIKSLQSLCFLVESALYINKNAMRPL